MKKKQKNKHRRARICGQNGCERITLRERCERCRAELLAHAAIAAAR